MHLSDQYIWMFWSLFSLLPWLLLFLAFPKQRRIMWRASLWTMPFGLTEILFVPTYWDPPTAFGRSAPYGNGFDVESLIFSFGIGGIAVVLYNVLTGQTLQPVPVRERLGHRHRYHYLALAAPFIVFPPLYLVGWNPIYPGIVALFIGAFATMLCRPDLKKKTWIGGLLFLIYYQLFLLAVQWASPGYIERVWNLDALTGIRIFGAPIEELLFAIGFGTYWAGVYEHWTWTRLHGAHKSRHAA